MQRALRTPKTKAPSPEPDGQIHRHPKNQAPEGGFITTFCIYRPQCSGLQSGWGEDPGRTLGSHTLISLRVRAEERAERGRVLPDARQGRRQRKPEAQGSPRCHPRGLQESNPSPRPYEASSIQSSFSRMASMWGLVMTTSSSSNSEGSDWVSMAPMRSTMGLEGRAREAVAGWKAAADPSSQRPPGPQEEDGNEKVKAGTACPGPKPNPVDCSYGQGTWLDGEPRRQAGHGNKKKVTEN